MDLEEHWSFESLWRRSVGALKACGGGELDTSRGALVP
jgi:hypothetical protein